MSADAPLAGQPVLIPAGVFTPAQVATVVSLVEQGLITAFSPEFLQRMATSILGRVSDDNTMAGWHPATVVADNFTGGVHECTLYLDGADTTIAPQSAQVLTSDLLVPGVRVMCIWAPPSQLYVIGVLQPVVPPSIRAVDICNTHSVFPGDTPTLVPYWCIERSTAGMGVDSDGLVVAPIDGTYSINFSGQISTDASADIFMETSEPNTGGALPGGNWTDYIGAITLTSLLVELHAGATIGVYLSGGGDTSLRFQVLELVWISPYVDHSTCDCGCG